MTQIIKHHIKYKELRGVDEVILMTRSEHSKLHHRLRKEDKCTIPSEDLRKISCNSSQRKPQILHKNGLFELMFEQIQNKIIKKPNSIHIHCTNIKCPIHSSGWYYSGTKRYPGMATCPYCKGQVRIPKIESGN